MFTVINDKHMLCWDQIEDKKPIIQFKTIYGNLRVLFKHFSIYRFFYHHYHHYHNATRQQQEDWVSNEMLSHDRADSTEKKHVYEPLEMKQVTQGNVLTDTKAISSSNDNLGVVTTSASSSLPSASKRLS